MVAGSLLLAACGEDIDAPPATSIFNGEMSGAYTGTLDGEAVFGITQDAGGNSNGFALILGDGGAARIFLRISGTGKPPIGTYEIVAPGAPASDAVFRGTVGYAVNGALEQYEVRGGTITLTRRTHEAATGSFELRAERTSPCCDPAPVQIVITGTFDAGQIPQVF